jgi:glycosyltransferase involved in cell wall biosynthesis
MIRLSIIIPTIARQSLLRTLQALAPQLRDDEVIVVGDGPRPRVAGMIDGMGDHFRYMQGPATAEWGNAQRHTGLLHATGDYVWFVDDDDTPEPDALDAIRQAASEHPGKALMFRCQWNNYRYVPDGTVWWETEGDTLHVGTPMLVVPNVPEKLGSWLGPEYDHDYVFITETLALFGQENVVWVPKVILKTR